MEINESFHNRFNSPITNFYENTNVFITGGTGFLGKLLIEKLLRCTEISTIYMLIREKKGKSPEERLDDYFNDIVFDRLKSAKPKYRHKIVCVQGDCTLAGLGISLNDQNMLINNINVVFHVAASVNFDQKLTSAYLINVKGTESMLDLCKKAQNLKAFIYVSTAFSNCHVSNIEEKFYDIVSYKDIEVILKKIDEDKVEQCTKKILGNWPNTYTFTKALAESVVKDQGNGISMGIFRPAIVTSTYKEPLEGWNDNLNGPTGACAGAASGLIRVMQCKEEMIANIVPGDMCVSALIASAWDTANINAEKRVSNIPIYNYVSSVENPLTWGEYYKINKMYGNMYPLSNSVWCLKIILTSSSYLYTVRKLFYHYLPGMSLDFLGLFMGKKPRFFKLYNKVHKYTEVVSYFAMTDWSFKNDNVMNLWTKMKEEDRRLFPFSMATVNWISFFRTYILGIRLYLLKDPIETMPQAKLRHKRLKVLHSMLKVGFWFISVNFLWHTFLGNLYLFTTKGLTNK